MLALGIFLSLATTSIKATITCINKLAARRTSIGLIVHVQSSFSPQ